MELMQSQALRLSRLGTAYLVVKRTEDALRAARQALELSRARKERGDEAYTLSLLGEIASCCDPADVGTAKARYGEALRLAEELGMRPLIAHCHFGLAKLNRRMGKAGQAREHLDIATAMYREMEMTYWLEQAAAEMRQFG